MKTRIRTAHEETYQQSESEKTIGILENYSIEQNDQWKESFSYIYNQGVYIFFDTIIELIDYLLYGEKGMKRAYMKENIFDEYYDASYINAQWTEVLEWIEE